MAAPVYTEDLTDIDLAEATGSYAALGGGGAGLSADIDFAIQTPNSITKQVSNARKGIVFDNGVGITIPAGDHIYIWIYCTTPGLLDTLAVGGLSITIGDGTGARVEFHIVGAAEYAEGGWICIPINYITTSSGSHPYRTLVGSPSGDPQFFGGIADTTTTVKAVNFSIDAMRYGTGAYITAGDSGDPATFAGFATQNDNASNRWGILAEIPGGYSLQGRFVVGQNNVLTPTLAYFDDSNTLIVLPDTFHTTADFTQIIIDHASTIFNLTSVTILALGTINPGRLVFNNASTISALTSCVFNGLGISTLRAGVTALNCIWQGSEKVTANDADVSGSKFLEPTVIAGDAALQWDEVLSAPKVLSKLDNTAYSQGVNAHHAITFGTGVDEDITLTGLDFTGFANGDNVDGSVFEFLATSGSLTLNLIGCTTDDTFSVDDTAGITVTVVQDPVTTEITVIDTDIPPVVIANARVFLETSDGTGPLPFEEVITITQTGGTATVAHTAHGFITGNYVVIRGAAENEYNKVAQVTVTTVNAYTYTVDSGTASPATGSPIASGVIISALTDGSGIASDTRTFSGNQPFKGWIRKSSSSPYYKNSSITGIINNTGGFSASVTLLPDE